MTKSLIKPKTIVKKMFVTPVGRLVYPYLDAPDTGRMESDGKYKCGIMWPKEEFAQVCKEFQKAVLEVAREACQMPKIKLDQVYHCFRDGDQRDNPGVYAGHIYILPKSKFPPAIVAPRLVNGRAQPLSEDEVKNIKGGDYGRATVTISSYTLKEGGITTYLNVLQFSHSGDALGGLTAAAMNQLDDLEVPVEDLPAEEEEQEDQEEQEEQEASDSSDDSESFGDDSLALFG